MAWHRNKTMEPRPGDMPERMIAGRCEALLQTPDERWTQCESRATKGRMCSEHHAQWLATWGQT